MCKNCYKLYELTEELKELVRQFSNAVGVPAKINNNDEIKPGVEMPDDWMLTLPPASNAVTVVND